jgi:acyl-CoA thioester hydrolase
VGDAPSGGHEPGGGPHGVHEHGVHEHEVHEHEVQLRWSDPDTYGHVNHARALSLIEDARLALGAEAPGLGAGPSSRAQPAWILARLEVDYLRQLHYRAGERLTVRTWVVRLGTSSLTLRHELTQDGAVAIRSDAVCVLFDHERQASRPLSAEERAWWGRLLAEG